jgi:hypothetical protein
MLCLSYRIITVWTSSSATTLEEIMSTTNKAKDRGPAGRLRRKYRRTYMPNYASTPKWWRKLFMTRPQRRKNTLVSKRVLQGVDPDSLILPLGNRKPHKYYS